MARAQAPVTDLRHFIEEGTDDWGDLPGPALNLAIALGSIVAWVTDHLPAGEPHTNVACWRSPGWKRSGTADAASMLAGRARHTESRALLLSGSAVHSYCLDVSVASDITACRIHDSANEVTRSWSRVHSNRRYRAPSLRSQTVI